MAVIKKWRIFVFFAVCLVVKIEEATSSQEVMKKLTNGFSTALDQCRNELNIKDEIMQDFFNFWKEDYALLNREMGCVLMCMASKFNLITEDFKVHHVNAHEFAKLHGADDTMAKQLVTIIHECEKAHEAVVDDCSRVLEMAKCFKTRIHELKWAPSMEEILEEVMTELEPK